MNRPLKQFLFLTGLNVWVLATLADGIVSAPAGFVRVVAQPEEQTPASLPFVPFDFALENIVQGQFDASDQISVWNPVGQIWSVFTKAESGGGWEDTNGASAHVTLEAGDALWIRNRQTEARSIFLAGTVVLDDRSDSLFYPGLNTLGYPFSTGARVRDTDLPPLLATNTVAPNALLKPETATSPSWLGMGRAYWFARNNGGSNALWWGEARPYGTFFDLAQGLAITKLSPVDRGRAVEVSFTIPAGVAALDIFWQDVPPDSERTAFEPLANWHLATAGVSFAQGAATLLSPSSFIWTDHGANNRPAPGDTRGRYYLLARADVDADRDGLPDARARLTPGDALAQAAVSNPWNPWTTNLPNLGTTTGAVAGVPAGGAGMVAAPPAAASAGSIVYVDAWTGRDSNTGRRPQHTAVDGPKATIRAGMKEARDGDQIIIRDGMYGESLDLSHRGNLVRFEGIVHLSEHPPRRPAGPSTPAEFQGIATNLTGTAVTNPPNRTAQGEAP